MTVIVVKGKILAAKIMPEMIFVLIIDYKYNIFNF